MRCIYAQIHYSFVPQVITCCIILVTYKHTTQTHPSLVPFHIAPSFGGILSPKKGVVRNYSELPEEEYGGTYKPVFCWVASLGVNREIFRFISGNFSRREEISCIYRNFLFPLTTVYTSVNRHFVIAVIEQNKR